MGESINIKLDLDSLNPDVRRKVEGMHKQHTLNRFLTLSLNNVISRMLNGESVVEERTSQLASLDKTQTLILNLLLDIRENTLNINNNIVSTQAPNLNVNLDLLSKLSSSIGDASVPLAKVSTSEKSDAGISFNNEDVSTEPVIINTTSDNSNDFSNLAKLKKLKGGN